MLFILKFYVVNVRLMFNFIAVFDSNLSLL